MLLRASNAALPSLKGRFADSPIGFVIGIVLSADKALILMPES